ncbi:hypothetical protein BC828DRAFT_379175 [Blastocladiella britannica]|nr:hypothetical protein BC828DRAFT_379175 [Blastocladiella britannica]
MTSSSPALPAWHQSFPPGSDALCRDVDAMLEAVSPAHAALVLKVIHTLSSFTTTTKRTRQQAALDGESDDDNIDASSIAAKRSRRTLPATKPVQQETPALALVHDVSATVPVRRKLILALTASAVVLQTPPNGDTAAGTAARIAYADISRAFFVTVPGRATRQRMLVVLSRSHNVELAKGSKADPYGSLRPTALAAVIPESEIDAISGLVPESMMGDGERPSLADVFQHLSRHTLDDYSDAHTAVYLPGVPVANSQPPTLAVAAHLKQSSVHLWLRNDGIFVGLKLPLLWIGFEDMVSAQVVPNGKSMVDVEVAAVRRSDSGDDATINICLHMIDGRERDRLHAYFARHRPAFGKPRAGGSAVIGAQLLLPYLHHGHDDDEDDEDFAIDSSSSSSSSGSDSDSSDDSDENEEDKEEDDEGSQEGDDEEEKDQAQNRSNKDDHDELGDQV